MVSSSEGRLWWQGEQPEQDGSSRSLQSDGGGGADKRWHPSPTLVAVCLALLAVGTSVSVSVFLTTNASLQRSVDTTLRSIETSLLTNLNLTASRVTDSLAIGGEVFALGETVDEANHPHTNVSSVSLAAFSRITATFSRQSPSLVFHAFVPRVANASVWDDWVASSFPSSFPSIARLPPPPPPPPPPPAFPAFPIAFTNPPLPGPPLPPHSLVVASGVLEQAAQRGEITAGAPRDAWGMNVVPVATAILPGGVGGAEEGWGGGMNDTALLGFFVVLVRPDVLVCQAFAKPLHTHPQVWVKVEDEDGTLLFSGRDRDNCTTASQSPPHRSSVFATHTLHTTLSLHHRPWSLTVVEVDPVATTAQYAQPWACLWGGVGLTVATVLLVAIAGTRSELQAQVLTQMVRAMRDFTAMVTHDLRTPVFVLDGLIQQVADTRLAPEQREVVEDQRVCHHVMQQIIDNVVTHEKIASGQAAKLVPTISHVDVASVVRRVVKVTRVYQLSDEVAVRVVLGRVGKGVYKPSGPHQPTARARIVPTESALVVHTDERWAQQVMMNFVSNALKFTTAGCVELRVAVVDTGAAHEGEDEGEGARGGAEGGEGKGGPGAANGVVEGKGSWRGRGGTTVQGQGQGEGDIETGGSGGGGGGGSGGGGGRGRGGQRQGPAAQRPAPSSFWLRVEVHDTGKGVTEAQAKSLFQRFSQLQNNKGGLGLGLFSVQALCHALQGTCGVCARLDGQQGAVFWAAFPVALCGSECLPRSDSPKSSPVPRLHTAASPRKGRPRRGSSASSNTPPLVASATELSHQRKSYSPGLLARRRVGGVSPVFGLRRWHELTPSPDNDNEMGLELEELKLERAHSHASNSGGGGGGGGGGEAGARRCVLLDSVGISRKATARVLSSLGFSVVGLLQAPELVRALDTPAKRQSYHLVVVDAQLGDARSVVEAVQRVRQLEAEAEAEAEGREAREGQEGEGEEGEEGGGRQGLPLVGLSGLSWVSIQGLLDAGFDAVVRKPVVAAQLSASLESIGVLV